MFIATEASKFIFEFEIAVAEVEKVIFHMSLMGTTIQDSSMRERRDT